MEENKIIDDKQESQNKDYEFSSFYAKGLTDNYFGLDLFRVYTPQEIITMVESPMVHNQSLRKLSNRLYCSNGLLTQCIDYCTSLPTLDYCIIPKGNNKTKRKKNKVLMEESLRSIRHKELVRDALFKSMVDGIAFYYCIFTKPKKDNVRTLSDYDVDNILEINNLDVNMSVLPLPTDYTKIIGRKNSSYVLAFNLRYFETLNEAEQKRKLKLYPEEIRKGWVEFSTGKKNNNWLVLDNDKTIVSKVRSKMEEAWGRPLCLAGIKNILYSSYFQDTCRSTLDEVNNRIVYETFPEGKEKGSCSLTKKQQEEQHNVVKNAVLQKNARGSTSFFSVASGTKIETIDVDTSVLDEKNSSYIQDLIGIDLGFMANLLSGSGSGNYSAQQNNLQLLLSEVLMWLEPITEEIVKVINANVIKDKTNPVGLYYLPCSYITRKDFTTQMKELYLQGKGSLRAWISSTGFNSEAYLSLMDDELAEKFEEKYPAHQTSYTLTSDNKGGRPTKDDSTNDNTIASKSNNSNDIPSPSDS